MKFTPDTTNVGTHRTGEAVKTYNEMVAFIGFPPNAASDPDKVFNSWQFTYRGRVYAAWDYRQPYDPAEVPNVITCWSLYGNWSELPGFSQ